MSFQISDDSTVLKSWQQISNAIGWKMSRKTVARLYNRTTMQCREADSQCVSRSFFVTYKVFQPWHVNCIHINKPVPTTGLLSIAFLHQMMYNGGRLTTFLEHLASFNKSWELRKSLWGQNNFEIVRFIPNSELLISN